MSSDQIPLLARSHDSTKTSWIPTWIHNVGTAAWLVDPDARLAYCNQPAVHMLKRERRDIIGRPCHEVICGSDIRGKAFCGPACPVVHMVEADRPVEPFRLYIRNTSGPGRWVRVLVIILVAPDHSGPWLLHCALDDERSYRVESYFSRVMLRTSHEDLQNQSITDLGLTHRELEVLRLLVKDETLQGIANHLNVSYATVRNHIQHILHKLDVHSIMEAVAYYLLKAK